MTRIVHLIAEFSAHEAMGRTVLETATRVPGEHYLITTRAHDDPGSFAEVIELGGSMTTFPLRQSRGLQTTLARLKPEIIHVHGGALSPLLSARVGLATTPTVATLYAWPTVPTLRQLRAGGLRAATQSNVLQPRVLATTVLPAKTVGRALDRTGTTVVLSPDQRVQERLRHWPGEVRILGSGAPVDQRRAHYRSSDPTIIFAGRAESARGVSELLAAFTTVRAHLPQARLRLLLIPRPELKTLLTEVSEAGLADSVEVNTEPVPDLLAEFAEAQLGVWPFRFDYTTSPPAMAVAEALSVGLPVVSTDVACVRSVIAAGRNGELVPPNNPVALAQAMLDVLTQRGRWEDLATAGPRSVADKTWAGAAQTTAAAYEEVLRSRSAPKSSTANAITDSP